MGDTRKYGPRPCPTPQKGMETGVRPALSQTQGVRPHASKARNKKQIRGKIAAIRAGGKTKKRQGGSIVSGAISE